MWEDFGNETFFNSWPSFVCKCKSLEKAARRRASQRDKWSVESAKQVFVFVGRQTWQNRKLTKQKKNNKVIVIARLSHDRRMLIDQ